MNSENNVWITERNIIMGDDVTPQSISSIIRSIIQFNNEDSDKIQDKKDVIKLYITTRGGSVYDALALVDVMRKSKTPIHTYALGQCFSAGFIIFVSGHKRYIGNNAFAMWHPSWCFTGGTAVDVETDLNQMKSHDKLFDDIVVERTKISQKQLNEKRKTKTDWYFSAAQCIEHGVADEYFEEL